MRKFTVCAALAAALAISGGASAAVRTLDFSVAAGLWEQNYTGGENSADNAPVTDAPFGLSLDPTLSGSVTFDDAVFNASTFSAFDFVTGTRHWTLADINPSGSMLLLDGGAPVDVHLTLGPFASNGGGAAGVNGVDIELAKPAGGGDALLGTATTFFPQPDGVGIFCNGCVSFTDVTPAAAPEPSTWALALGGFALAGAALRRRRRVLA